MRVIILGLPHFATELTQLLSAHDKVNTYRCFNTYESKLDQLKLLFFLPFADIVVSMNGVSKKSGSLDWVLRWKKKLVMQWMGTDAQNALKRKADGTIYTRYMDYAEHWVDSSWLHEEVSALGYNPIEVYYKALKGKVPVGHKFESLGVLSYVPQKRQQFYGFEQILELAAKYPTIPFDIVASTSTPFEASPNVRFHGWVSPEEIYNKMLERPIYIRLTEHDGYALTVLEALARGCEVLWTFPIEGGHWVQGDLEASFKSAIEEIEKRDFQAHTERAEAILLKFEASKIASKYINQLHVSTAKK